jgi:hypothetical protein
MHPPVKQLACRSLIRPSCCSCNFRACLAARLRSVCIRACNRWSALGRAERYRNRCGDEGGPADDPENPLPGFIDPITLQPVVTPTISPLGHVMGLATWKACSLPSSGDVKNLSSVQGRSSEEAAALCAHAFKHTKLRGYARAAWHIWPGRSAAQHARPHLIRRARRRH